MCLLYFCYIIISTPLWAYRELYVFRSSRAHYDLNKSFEHVQNDLIARGAQYELSAIARDNGVFFHRRAGIVLIVSRFHGYMDRSLLRPYYEVRERSRALRELHTIQQDLNTIVTSRHRSCP